MSLEIFAIMVLVMVIGAVVALAWHHSKKHQQREQHRKEQINTMPKE